MPKNKPRSNQIPNSSRVPRTMEEPNKLGSSFFRWRVNSKYVDLQHPEWGWGRLNCKDFFNILMERLHEFEQMTWDDLASRKSCHPMPVEHICAAAQKQLSQVCDEIDSLYQVDISPKCRLWGYRDRTIFYLIWHDPNHTVYPTSRH
jgi:hypothetical protein